MNNGSSGYSYTELKELVEYMEMLEKENERLRKLPVYFKSRS